MAVKIRNSNIRCCDSCKSDEGKFYDIGFGNKNNMNITTLCDECMHTLLQKLIIVGREENEVR